MHYDIKKLCRISGFNPELENLDQLEKDLNRNIEIVSALDKIKIDDNIEVEIHEDKSQEDIPVKFDNVEKLRAQFPNRIGNELKVPKVL